jgi:glycosyltransferase involved in cell wall biosynthesis
VVVAPNGIVERALDPARAREWERRLRGMRFALFVGSAYPPNARGFWEMFAPSLAFLAPDERVVVVGGIGAIVMDVPAARVWERINASRLECVGMQDEADLAALLSLACCVVLPITIGGGSNIKTAEAIFSGEPVVGTTTSLRGYEALASLPGLHWTDEPGEFRRHVRGALDRGRAAPDRSEARRRVLWDETLGRLPADLAALSPAGA